MPLLHREPRANSNMEQQQDAAVSFGPYAAESETPPPVAAKRSVEQVLHGDHRIDDYSWLRHKRDPEVVAYLDAENTYTDAIMRRTLALQDKLYQEMLSRIQQTDLSVPYRLRGYDYFTRTEEGKQYPIHCRRKAEEGANDETLLDLNRLAEGHSFLGLGVYEVSDDNYLLAYSLDDTGFRQYALHVKDLQTGTVLPFRAERVTSAAWAADNTTLFYTVEDETTKRSHRLYRCLLGSGAPAELIYEESDERFRIDVERTRSGAFLLLVIASHTTSEVRLLRADHSRGEFQLIAPREGAHQYYVDHHPGDPAEKQGGVFYIRSNSGGRTFRLVAAPVANPSRANWREVVPHRPEVMLAHLDAFQTHLLLFEREDGLPHLRVVTFDHGAEPPDLLAASHRIAFSEPAYHAMAGNNPEFLQTHVRYQYESFITPRSVFDYDVQSRQSALRKQQPVLGGYDASQYATERLHAVASDGTRIPLSVVYRRDTLLDANAPLLLYGYGSYGIPVPVSFSSNRLSLLDRGAIYAVAHVRGGGELGKPWHDAGRMHNKRNSFTDFISAAEFLCEKNYTSPEDLAIEGGSAGGLLMGAVANLRPDLFHAVVSHVPFVDVLNTMLDESLPLTVGEFEEWGNPKIAEDYFYMKTYCPYTNLARKAYPAMLIKTSLNDSQVMYWEPAKYVAKLRTLKTDDNLLLLKINMGAGHGGASGRYDYLREIALDYAFLLSQWGITT